jgi:hypothetical protein
MEEDEQNQMAGIIMGPYQNSYDESENNVRGTITQSQLESNMHVNWMVNNNLITQNHLLDSYSLGLNSP